MFKHNQKVTCEIDGTKITDARISIDEDGTPYICQNEEEGDEASNLLGYEYSWRLSSDFISNYVENLRPALKSFDFPKIGDEYKDEDGDSIFVLGVAGRVIFLSAYNNKDEYGNGYTKEELLKLEGTTVQDIEETEEETEEELTVKQGEEEFDKFCILNKDGKCKYWKPEAFGYAEDDREAPLNKFFPEEIKNFISKGREETVEHLKEKVAEIISNEFWELEEIEKDFKINQKIIKTRNKIKFRILEEL